MRAVTYDEVGGMRSLLQICFGMTGLATLLPSLGSAKHVWESWIWIQSTLLHHEVSLIGVRHWCGLRGKISIISMRPW